MRARVGKLCFVKLDDDVHHRPDYLFIKLHIGLEGNGFVLSSVLVGYFA